MVSEDSVRLTFTRDDSDGKVVALDVGVEHFLLARPLVAETWDGETARRYEEPYTTVVGTRAEAVLRLPGAGVLTAVDDWSVEGDLIRVRRRVTVTEARDGGFLTELGMELPPGTHRVFVPGMLYGTGRINAAAMGSPAGAAAGIADMYIREDRMPAPMLSVRLEGGSSLSLLSPEPDGSTSWADSTDVAVVPMTDGRFRFGALGLSAQSNGCRLAYRFPGSEGEVTYRGNTFPDGQVRQWRRRYHPFTFGFVQEYVLEWRFGSEASFAEQVRDSWRWAWSRLQPRVARQNIPAARAALFEQLASTVTTGAGGVGIPLFLDARTGALYQPAHRQETHALMGFTGRNTDCAWYLIREADRVAPDKAAQYRRLGGSILDSFARLPAAPPAGEGFDLRDGSAVSSAPHQARDDVMLLRGLTEGAKSTLKAWRYETAAGRDHPGWRSWAMDLTDWIHQQQRADGSVPRAWLLGSAEVADPSGFSSYNAASLFVEAFRATGDQSYLQAAEAAGNFAWSAGQGECVFVGGTLDNPDVIDKEAGTLSLEAYLALHEVTGATRWLTRAKAAADYSETWIYLWNVPMPDENESDRGWKREASTVGVQLIASGHSLVDHYMAFDVGSYAKLWRVTGDQHYYDVARLLLHNTKTMLAVPGRLFDLAGPGWQQEHWSLAPVRGDGLHRGWLPWLTCSHLEGIAVTEDYDPELLEELSAG